MWANTFDWNFLCLAANVGRFCLTDLRESTFHPENNDTGTSRTPAGVSEIPEEISWRKARLCSALSLCPPPWRRHAALWFGRSFRQIWSSRATTSLRFELLCEVTADVHYCAGGRGFSSSIGSDKCAARQNSQRSHEKIKVQLDIQRQDWWRIRQTERPKQV